MAKTNRFYRTKAAAKAAERATIERVSKARADGYALGYADGRRDSLENAYQITVSAEQALTRALQTMVERVRTMMKQKDVEPPDRLLVCTKRVILKPGDMVVGTTSGQLAVVMSVTPQPKRRGSRGKKA